MEFVNEIKDFLTDCPSLARAMYLPMAKKERIEYKERIRKLVEEYKPKIEDKTNFNIGQVRVENYLKETNSCFWRISRKNIEEINKKIENPHLLQRGLANIIGGMTHTTIYPLFLSWTLFRNNVIFFGAIDDCVAVPSGMETKINLWREKRFEKDLNLDQKVVHELSHILWHKIENGKEVKIGDFSNYKRWSEGFATFCEQEHFSGIYPRGYNLITDAELYPKKYVIGKERVKQIIEKYGQEVLLEIPNKWKEFELKQKLEVSKK